MGLRQYTLRVVGIVLGFDSGWAPIESQGGEKSFVEVSHGLGRLSTSFKVQLRRTSNPSEIFFALGTAQADEYYRRSYGGLLAAASSSKVRLWAPDAARYFQNGYLFHVLEGAAGSICETCPHGGKVNRHGPSHIKHHKGEFRILIDDLVIPDFDSGWFEMKSHSFDESFKRIEHGITSMSNAIVDVSYRSRNPESPNKGFVFKASPVARGNVHEGRYGGIVYSYSNSHVYVWAPNFKSRKSRMPFEYIDRAHSHPCSSFGDDYVYLAGSADIDTQEDICTTWKESSSTSSRRRSSSSSSSLCASYNIDTYDQNFRTGDRCVRRDENNAIIDWQCPVGCVIAKPCCRFYTPVVNYYSSSSSTSNSERKGWYDRRRNPPRPFCVRAEEGLALNAIYGHRAYPHGVGNIPCRLSDYELSGSMASVDTKYVFGRIQGEIEKKVVLDKNALIYLEGIEHYTGLRKVVRKPWFGNSQWNTMQHIGQTLISTRRIAEAKMTRAIFQTDVQQQYENANGGQEITSPVDENTFTSKIQVVTVEVPDIDMVQVVRIYSSFSENMEVRRQRYRLRCRANTGWLKFIILDNSIDDPENASQAPHLAVALVVAVVKADCSQDTYKSIRIGVNSTLQEITDALAGITRIGTTYMRNYVGGVSVGYSYTPNVEVSANTQRTLCHERYPEDIEIAFFYETKGYAGQIPFIALATESDPDDDSDVEEALMNKDPVYRISLSGHIRGGYFSIRFQRFDSSHVFSTTPLESNSSDIDLANAIMAADAGMEFDNITVSRSTFVASSDQSCWSEDHCFHWDITFAGAWSGIDITRYFSVALVDVELDIGKPRVEIVEIEKGSNTTKETQVIRTTGDIRAGSLSVISTSSYLCPASSSCNVNIQFDASDNDFATALRSIFKSTISLSVTRSAVTDTTDCNNCYEWSITFDEGQDLSLMEVSSENLNTTVASSSGTHVQPGVSNIGTGVEFEEIEQGAAPASGSFRLKFKGSMTNFFEL